MEFSESDSSGEHSLTNLDVIAEYIISEKNNLLVHGGAGTGKSTLIKKLVERMENVAVIAPTGTAALNLGEDVGASTIHSMFGFKLGILGSDTSWLKTMSTQRRESLEPLETLVIDEISMVNADVMDAIDISLQAARKNSRPFGGVRLIMVGDLFQLPPVLNSKDTELKEYVKSHYGSFWFFKAKAWNASDFDLFILQTSYRQTDDKFKDVLTKLRLGTGTDEEIRWLNSFVRPESAVPEGAIRIVGTNSEVDKVNVSRLEEIDEEPKVFEGKWEELRSISDEDMRRFKNERPVDEQLILKVGAQVMFVKNDDQNTDGVVRRWVNGTTGIITSFSTRGVIVRIGEKPPIVVGVSKWEFIKHEIEEEYVEEIGRIRQVLRATPCLSYEQLPLVPAWAITTHKSQGKTYESAVISIGAMSKHPGHSYVALSRVREPEGMCLTRKVSLSDFNVDDEVKAFLEGHTRKRTERELIDGQNFSVL